MSDLELHFSTALLVLSDCVPVLHIYDFLWMLLETYVPILFLCEYIKAWNMSELQLHLEGNSKSNFMTHFGSPYMTFYRWVYVYDTFWLSICDFPSVSVWFWHILTLHIWLSICVCGFDTFWLFIYDFLSVSVCLLGSNNKVAIKVNLQVK